MLPVFPDALVAFDDERLRMAFDVCATCKDRLDTANMRLLQVGKLVFSGCVADCAVAGHAD